MFKKILHQLNLIPLLIPVFMTALSVGMVILLLVDYYNSFTIITNIIFAIFIAYLSYLKILKNFDLNYSNTYILLILIFVFMWVGVNAFFSSQHISTDRDPATYVNAAIWLKENDSIRIDNLEVAFNDELITQSSAGFSDNDSFIEAQGTHILPALTGAFGRLTGIKIMLTFNAIIAGLALIAFFGFARTITREIYALGATITLGLTLPMIYFARDMYTEPLLLLFIFGALSWILIATQNKQLASWAMAGIIAGATLIVRIDAIMVLIGIYAALFYYVITYQNKADFKTRINHLNVYLLATVLTGLLGLLDIIVLSNVYYKGHDHLIIRQILGVIAVVIVGYFAVFITKNKKTRERLNKYTKKWRAKAAFVSILLIGLALSIYSAFNFNNITYSEVNQKEMALNTNQIVGSLSDYGGFALHWVSWYLGPLTIWLAFIGAAIMAYKSMQKARFKYFLVLTVIFSSALVYLHTPFITPDQIWGIRRFLPVVIPGFILLSFYVLQLISDSRLNKRAKPLVIASLLVLMVGYPITVSDNFIDKATHRPQLAQAFTVCDRIKEENAVVIWAGMAGLNQIMPTKSVCNIQAVRFKTDDISSSQINELARSLRTDGYEPYIAVYGYQAGIIPEDIRGRMKNISSIDYDVYQRELDSAPYDMATNSRTILLKRM